MCASLDASLATRQEWGEAPLAMLRFLEGVGSSAMEGYRSAAARLVASMATGGAGAKGSDMLIVGNLAALDRAHGLADAGHGPPPPDVLDGLMDNLCEYVSSASTTPPLLRAALAHAQFETVHPFLDGNGRIGRALVHLMLRRDGLLDRTVLPLSGTWGRDKPRYIGYLTALRSPGDGWDVDSLNVAAHFMADTTTEAATGAFAIAAAVQGVEGAMGERVRENFRVDSVTHRIVHDVCVNLGVTVDTVAAGHGVDSVTVLRALDRMESLGIVTRRSAQRPHVFYAPVQRVLCQSGTPDGPFPGTGRVTVLDEHTTHRIFERAGWCMDRWSLPQSTGTCRGPDRCR